MRIKHIQRSARLIWNHSYDKIRPIMTIERLSSPDGLPFNKPVDEIISDNRNRVETLLPGQYDITPAAYAATENPFKYDLLVHKDGMGTLRMIAKYPNARYRVFSPDGASESEKRGGKIIVLPTDKEAVALASPTGRELYEIILYRPER